MISVETAKCTWKDKGNKGIGCSTRAYAKRRAPVVRARSGIGRLPLNLSGTYKVVFVEMDWNEPAFRNMKGMTAPTVSNR